MSSRSGSISEDWEELSNVGSVTSLDGESKSTSTATVETQTPAIVPPTVAGPSSAQLQLPLRLRQDETAYSQLSSTSTRPHWGEWENVPPSGYLPYPFQHGTSTRTNISMSMGAGVPLAVRHDRPSAQEYQGFWFEDGFETLELGPIQIPRVGKLGPTEDPREYHEACATARRSLLEVQRLADNIGGGKSLVMDDLCATCGLLLVQVAELGKMAKLYAQHWMVQKSKGDPTDCPLELDVWKLLKQLLSKLRSIAAELKGDMPDYINSMRLDGRTRLMGLGMGGREENLVDISSHFANLMPILRADFDKYRTKHMDVQPATTSASEKPTRRVPHSPDVNLICIELSALKASLVSASAFLKQLCSNGECKYIMGPGMTDTVDSIIDVIAKTLTISPLGWADSAAKGGLKYSQVVEFSVECIQELVRDLKCYQRVIDITAAVPDYEPYQLRLDVAMQGIRDVVEVLEVLLLDPIGSD
ncbi:hypothetical protein FPSE5266_07780 [Fusarium pseudograminearum]|nr:hypothetical protein FPSE5266_07780 [Fusarium pseudograminearum]